MFFGVFFRRRSLLHLDVHAYVFYMFEVDSTHSSVGFLSSPFLYFLLTNLSCSYVGVVVVSKVIFTYLFMHLSTVHFVAVVL